MAEKGKYRHLRGKLPGYRKVPDWFTGGEEKWAARVEEEKRALVGGAENPEDASRERMARLFADAKLRKRELEAELHGVNARLEALDQILRFQLEEDGAEKVVLSNGLTIGLKDELYPSVEDRAKFFAYIKRTGQTNLLTMAWQTTRTLAAELALAGKEPPPGIKLFLKTSVGLYGLAGHKEGGE